LPSLGGQISDRPVQPPLQKYFCSHLAQITSLSSAIPAHTGMIVEHGCHVGKHAWTSKLLICRHLFPFLSIHVLRLFIAGLLPAMAQP
jgi:hypothetical protein